MLFPARLHDGLRDGSITLAFRSWRRPSVKAGGTLVTPGGLLSIDRVVVVDPDDISEADADRTGTTLPDLLDLLARNDDRRIYRIEFHRIGDDPRIAARADDALDDDALAEIDRRLARLDTASRIGPWTVATLAAIRDHPAVVSTVLAEGLGQERPAFKLNVRKLKGLGLTESLEVGYRLSPRGARYLELRPDGPSAATPRPKGSR